MAILRLSNIKLRAGAFMLALIAVIIFLITPHQAGAQQVGVSITPATIEETLDPSQEQTYTLTIENLNSSDQKYYLFTKNISGVENGGCQYLQKSDQEVTGYELTDWIDLPLNEVDVSAGEEYSFQFKISVPENATPGSHFGGIFISVDPPEIEKSGAAVGYQVANIISIRVSGKAKDEATIRQFSTTKFFYGSQNVDFLARIENTGNVLIRPVGLLEVYNMLGKKVGDVGFNTERSAVFPNDTREFNKISWQGNSIGFGRYEAQLSANYGDSGAKKSMYSTVSFWILPMNIIGPALAVLAVLFLIIFIFVRVYIKRSLSHINYGRRIVKKRRNNSSSTTLLVIVVTLTVTALFLIVMLALFA